VWDRYAAGAAIQVLLFSMLAAQLRVRAPGAKTFLRVIHSRFGPKAHVVYVVFAIATNLIVTAMLMTGGATVTNALIKDCPVALVSFLVAAIVGCHSLIGGMGESFPACFHAKSKIAKKISLFAIRCLVLHLLSLFRHYSHHHHVLHVKSLLQ
jgi:Na+(H+)/acetate symporter ActP